MREQTEPFRRDDSYYYPYIFKCTYQRLGDHENDLTERARLILRELRPDLLQLENRIRAITTEIKGIADAEETARRLMTIPGIGALGATAILAAVGDPPQDGPRHRCMAEARPEAASSRRQADAPWHRQERKQLSANPDRARRALDHDAPRQIE